MGRFHRHPDGTIHAHDTITTTAHDHAHEHP